MDKKLFDSLYKKWHEKHIIKPPEYVYKVLEIWNEENAFYPNAKVFFERTCWNGRSFESIL